MHSLVIDVLGVTLFPICQE
uniref:Uncharacterized protein n=1 Tax=Anguilla anguilla TaxID=7936 RepID=A0A0E9U5S2_ANGAN